MQENELSEEARDEPAPEVPEEEERPKDERFEMLEVHIEEDMHRKEERSENPLPEEKMQENELSKEAM